MSHVNPRPPSEVPGLQPVFQAAEAAMGFVPNSMRTMAHLPQLPFAFASLANVIFGGDLKALMAGLADRIPEQEDAEQNLPPGLVQLIAFAVSLAAGSAPNESGSGHFRRLREHFTDRQIVQIAGVVALFGFLNRWNDTLATELEAMPREFAANTLGSIDWQAGKHAS